MSARHQVRLQAGVSFRTRRSQKGAKLRSLELAGLPAISSADLHGSRKAWSLTFSPTPFFLGGRFLPFVPRSLPPSLFQLLLRWSAASYGRVAPRPARTKQDASRGKRREVILSRFLRRMFLLRAARLRSASVLRARICARMRLSVTIFDRALAGGRVKWLSVREMPK